MTALGDALAARHDIHFGPPVLLDANYRYVEVLLAFASHHAVFLSTMIFRTSGFRSTLVMGFLKTCGAWLT
jgi:hypothetical protein